MVLTVVGTIVHTQDECADSGERPRPVIGVLAKNPFFDGALPKEFEDDEAVSLRALKGVELLLCSLRDWHDEGDSIDNYMLEGFETTEAHYTHIMRPFGRVGPRQNRRIALQRVPAFVYISQQDSVGLAE